MPTISVSDRDGDVRVDEQLPLRLCNVLTKALLALARAARAIEKIEIVPVTTKIGPQEVLIKFTFEADIFAQESLIQRQNFLQFLCDENFEHHLVGVILEHVHEKLETYLDEISETSFDISIMIKDSSRAMEEHNLFIAGLLEDPKFHIENESAPTAGESPSSCPSCRNGSVQPIGPAFKCEFCNTRFVLEPSLANSNGNSE